MKPEQPPPDSRAWRPGAGLAAAVFAADLASKWWLLYGLELGRRGAIEITPFFNLVLVWNRGISFGLFNDGGVSGRWLLVALTAAIIIGLAVWLVRAQGRFLAIALGLVIGGAIGNMYDRIVYGAVRDFFDVHIGSHHWPAFNLADSAISVGVALLIWDAVMGTGDEAESTDRTG